MEIINEIIDRLQKGESPAALAKHIPWEALSEDERQALMFETEDRRTSRLGYDLIRYLFMISKDDFYRIQALQLAVYHPQLDIKQRRGTLDSISRLLTRLEQRMDPGDALAQQKHGHLRAQYHYLMAENLREDGDLEGALGHIQQAKSILDGLGASTSVEELETTIRKINIEILDARIQSRQAVVEGLEAQIEACRERLKQLESRLKLGDSD